MAIDEERLAEIRAEYAAMFDGEHARWMVRDLLAMLDAQTRRAEDAERCVVTARDDIALDRETVDAQCEVMPRAPLRMLACGHEKRTHRTDVAHCRACRGEPHAVLTTAQCLERAASALRAAQEFENHALIARMRAAAYQRHIETTTKGDTDR